MTSTTTQTPARPAALAGWAMFDWAGQPFYTLVLTFLFAPYFANAVAPDPVTGQALWGYGASAAGLAVALLSPFLGAVAEEEAKSLYHSLGFRPAMLTRCWVKHVGT